MFSKTILLLGLAGAALAEPIPQAAPTSDFDFGAALSSALASETAFLNIYSDLPTLPAAVESFIATAATETSFDPCATTEPAWVKNLPESIKSALTSYEVAVESWYSEHASEFPSDTYTGALASYTAGGVDECNGGAAQTGSSPETTAAAATSAAGGKTTAVAGTGTGGKTTAAPAGSTTAKGAAASSTKSPGAASRPTGAMAAGLAGVVGMVGLMVAL